MIGSEIQFQFKFCVNYQFLIFLIFISTFFFLFEKEFTEKYNVLF